MDNEKQTVLVVDNDHESASNLARKMLATEAGEKLNIITEVKDSLVLDGEIDIGTVGQREEERPMVVVTGAGRSARHLMGVGLVAALTTGMTDRIVKRKEKPRISSRSVHQVLMTNEDQRWAPPTRTPVTEEDHAKVSAAEAKRARKAEKLRQQQEAK